MNTTTIPQFETRHRMKLALEAAGIEVAEMAAALGVTTQTVHNYLRGDRRPILAVVKQWAQVCDVPWEWIVTGELPNNETPGGSLRSKWNRLNDLVLA